MKMGCVELKNYTVFGERKISFVPGINVLIGENGTGKTHLMKLLYSAGFSAQGRISFANKLVRTMLPLNLQISRLLTRKQGNQSADVTVWATDDAGGDRQPLSIEFNKKTKKWNATTKGEEKWEGKFSAANMIFIPAKEVLSNNYNLNAAVERGNVQFDDTYLDILNAVKIDMTLGRDDRLKSKMLHDLEKIIGGKVVYDSREDMFYLRSGGVKQEFNLVSEGIRKMALLWTLVKNGALTEGTVLFWDEPEANINPSAIPVIARLILSLQRHGVQIFISTHDYFLSKYLDISRESGDTLRYHSFYLKDNILNYEGADKFTLLENNSIMSTFLSLYHKEVEASWNE